MVATIPKSHKNKCIECGSKNTCNKITKDNGIGAGSVTCIHQEARINNIPDIDLMSDLA